MLLVAEIYWYIISDSLIAIIKFQLSSRGYTNSRCNEIKSGREERKCRLPWPLTPIIKRRISTSVKHGVNSNQLTRTVHLVIYMRVSVSSWNWLFLILDCQLLLAAEVFWYVISDSPTAKIMFLNLCPPHRYIHTNKHTCVCLCLSAWYETLIRGNDTFTLCSEHPKRTHNIVKMNKKIIWGINFRYYYS